MNESEANNEAEYDDWMHSLPRDLQRDAMTAPNVPDMYWRARRKGWSAKDLINEAGKVVRKHGHDSMALIVHQMQRLSTTEPLAETKPVPLATDRFKCYVCGVFTSQREGDGNEAKGARFVCMDHLHGPHPGEPMLHPTLERRLSSHHNHGGNVHEGRYVANDND